MKCKKNKCVYFGENDFWASMNKCSLDGKSFSDADKKECPLPSFVEDHITLLRKLEEIK